MTDGNRAIANARIFRRALAYAKDFDMLVVQHAEELANLGRVVLPIAIKDHDLFALRVTKGLGVEASQTAVTVQFTSSAA